MKKGSIFMITEGEYQDNHLVATLYALVDFDFDAHVRRCKAQQGSNPSPCSTSLAESSRGMVRTRGLVRDSSRREFVDYLCTSGFARRIWVPVFWMGDDEDLPEDVEASHLRASFENFVDFCAVGKQEEVWFPGCSKEHTDCLAHPDLSVACRKKHQEEE